MTPKPVNAPLIAAGVTRVSLELQANSGYSLDAQRDFSDLEEKYTCAVKHVVVDDGYSGDDFTRPSIQQVLDLAASGQIQAVVFRHVDRFARNLEGGLRLIRLYREAGLQVLIGNLGWYDNERNLKTQLAIGLLFAEIVKDEIAEKSKAGVRAKILQGKPQGGGAIYGYRFVTKGEIVAEALRRGEERPKRPGNEFARVDAQLAVIPQIYTWLDEGLSCRAVCRELVAAGIPAPRSHWNPVTICKIASEESYVSGIWHYNKRRTVEPTKSRTIGPRHRKRSSWSQRPRAEWMPIPLPGGAIIDRALFDRVQAKLAKNKSLLAKPEAERFMLSSLVKCAICGYSCCGVTRTSKNRYYTCSNRDRVNGQHLCSQRSVRADLLDQVVWDSLDILTDREALLTKVEEHRAAIVGESNSGELVEKQARVKKLRNQMTEAARRELDEEDAQLRAFYGTRISELKEQINFLEKRVSMMQRAVQKFEINADAIVERIQAALRTAEPAERRAIVLDWIEDVRYADQSAEITVRVPLSGTAASGGSCKHDEPDVYSCPSFIPIILKRKVA